VKYTYLLLIPLLTVSVTTKCMDGYFKELIAEAKKNGSGIFIEATRDKTAVTVDDKTTQYVQVVGSGKEATRTYDMQNITAISIDGSNEGGNSTDDGKVKLIIEQILPSDDAAKETLTVTADDNILPYITFKTIGTGSVAIGLYALNKTFKCVKDIIIRCALKKYTRVDIKSHVHAQFAQAIKADNLHICAVGNCFTDCKKDASIEADCLYIDKQGNAKVQLMINAKKLDVLNNGNGELKLKGFAKEQDLKLHHGSYLAQKLESEKINMQVKGGSGSIKLLAKELITGTVSRNSNYAITYDGTPVVDLHQTL